MRSESRFDNDTPFHFDWCLFMPNGIHPNRVLMAMYPSYVDGVGPATVGDCPFGDQE